MIPATPPLRELEWVEGRGTRSSNSAPPIENRGSYDLAFQVQKVLAQALDNAIQQGWMRRKQKPEAKQKEEKSKNAPKHHPHIQWEKVPELLEAINIDR